MSPLLDDLLIGIALAASVGYALFSLGPVSLRRRMRAALAALAARLHLDAIARRLRDAGAGGCGGCGSCPTESDKAPASPPEIRVPAGNIGRRRR